MQVDKTQGVFLVLRKQLGCRDGILNLRLH
jgi:hypothetical protein